MFEIIDLYWERCNLHIVFNKKIDNVKVYLKNNSFKMLLSNIKDNSLVINITNTPEGSMLDRGKWCLLIDDKLITINSNLLSSLDDKSRIFKYRNDFYTYLIDFSIDDNMVFYINTEFMMKNKKYKKYLMLSEGENILDKIKIFIKIFGYFSINVLYKILHVFSNENRILFLNENGNDLTGNLKYLYDECKNMKIKSFCINRFNGRNKIFSYLREIFCIAISGKIVVDNYTPILTVLNLSKNTKLIQLWHAGVGFKSVGYARFGKVGSPHPYYSCHRNYNYVVVDCCDLKEIYKEVFGISSDIIRDIGIPRLQNYLNEDVINSVLEKLYKLNSKFKNNKVILFAPTYRGTGHKDAYYDYSKLDFEKIYNYCRENDFIFIMKFHPFIKVLSLIDKKFSEYIYNYSDLDINDLIYVADIMITDYSSCCYEYSIFNRPLIFYRYDKEIYEYFHPVHTIDLFTKDQYEVSGFDELMNILEKNKDIDIKDRFKRVKIRENVRSCDIIKSEVL